MQFIVSQKLIILCRVVLGKSSTDKKKLEMKGEKTKIVILGSQKHLIHPNIIKALNVINIYS